jgi:nucleotide-binding universal stress UspA family protein
MRLLVVWDGSGHAFDTLSNVADLIRSGSIEHIEVVIPLWPESDVPRWDDIHGRQVFVDDLHGAAAEIAGEDASRLLHALAPLAVHIDSRIINGDVVAGLVQAVEETRSDLLLVAAGTRDQSGLIGRAVARLMRESPVPTIVLRAPNVPAHH